MAKAKAKLAELKITSPYTILALNGDGEHGDTKTVNFWTPNCCFQDSTEDVKFTLALKTSPIKDPSDDCKVFADNDQALVDFSLDFTDPSQDKTTTSTIHDDGGVLPKSRGCTIGLRHLRGRRAIGLVHYEPRRDHRDLVLRLRGRGSTLHCCADRRLRIYYAMTLTPDETRRYARHLVLRDIGGDGQQKLKAARVLIVGAGRPRQPGDRLSGGGRRRHARGRRQRHCQPLQPAAADHPSHAGPGRRQGQECLDLHRWRSIRMCTSCHIRCGSTRAMPTNCYAGYDLVLDGTDNFDTRRFVAEACAARRACRWSPAQCRCGTAR